MKVNTNARTMQKRILGDKVESGEYITEVASLAVNISGFVA